MLCIVMLMYRSYYSLRWSYYELGSSIYSFFLLLDMSDGCIFTTTLNSPIIIKLVYSFDIHSFKTIIILEKGK
uniref:Uncharacterized protein n=1 Tax=Octopus bimaculoides TaxID=37653 RepID=A0A0L8IAV8_OCTBM